MEEFGKEDFSVFGVENGLIKPIDNYTKWELTEKGIELVKIASIVLVISYLQLLFKKVKK